MKKYLLITFFAGISVCQAEVPRLKLGVENISPTVLASMQKNRIGLITNQTGIDQQGRRTIDILRQQGVNITYLFAPEHGINGTILAAARVPDSVDEKTGIPVVSLYSSPTADHAPGQQYLDAIDMLVFDMQDSGMRHYTYISTLFYALKAAAANNKPIIVLDRPNPLGGLIEGPVVDPELFSFISIAPIPVRYGLTIGELAHYFNTYLLTPPAQLQIVPLSNYERMPSSELLMRVPLSPNLHSHAGLMGYSFLGLLGEIEPFDVGVGTEYAFRCLLLPDQAPYQGAVWSQVQHLLTLYGIASQPIQYVHSRKKIAYKGLCLTDIAVAQLSSFSLLLDIITLFKMHGVPFSFSAFFDKAVGTRLVREYVLNLGPDNVSGITVPLAESIAASLKRFWAQARHILLYPSTNVRVNYQVAKKVIR